MSRIRGELAHVCTGGGQDGGNGLDCIWLSLAIFAKSGQIAAGNIPQHSKRQPEMAKALSRVLSGTCQAELAAGGTIS